jgi:riboflavin kinase/FMN adenylyltransferase
VKVFRRLKPAPTQAPCALTIGNFDGVHRGHQALLRQLVEGARARHLRPCVLTFEPHPREFFSPHDAPPRIQNLRDKLMALRQCAIDTIAIEEFNQAFSKLSPSEFVQNILIEKLNTKWILIGDDFCYGAKRAGNFNSLVAAGKQFGFEVSRIPSVLETEERISSSLLRQSLEQGDMKRSTQLLGRPFSISGHVLYGKQLGRTLGFPTLNLAVCARHPNAKPVTSGIFVSQVHGLGEKPLPAVSSLGVRPSVESTGQVLLETHIFDFNRSIYGQVVCVELLTRLHEERKYPDLTTLQAAIQDDAQKARQYFLKKNSYV